MTVASMTGFARSDGSTGGLTWHWEVKSVNGRGLDVRLRLPPGFEDLEPKIRELCAGKLTRGSIAVLLNVKREAGVTSIRLNEEVLGQVLDAAERLRARAPGASYSVEGLIQIRGVLDYAEAEETDGERQQRNQAILAGFAAALDGVVEMRRQEGARLVGLIRDHVARIVHLVETVEASPLRQPEVIRERLRALVARLTDATPALDPDRLYQEAMLLADKADIEEEVQRLRAHCEAATELLAAREPVGRRLDFLAQEFNREANTLCSKSTSAEVTRVGLELKSVIDQLREQVQNVE
ncbi:MAG: YicC family protein [Hyphomicrobiaceae bacterium]|nr:YicC family protein [Hyphomicrobiaceae bacterium]